MGMGSAFCSFYIVFLVGAGLLVGKALKSAPKFKVAVATAVAAPILTVAGVGAYVYMKAPASNVPQVEPVEKQAKPIKSGDKFTFGSRACFVPHL